MKNNIKNISKVIYLLDKHIINILTKKEVDEIKLDTLTTVRIEFVQEMNGIIRGQNTSDMYDRKYFDSYRKTKF